MILEDIGNNIQSLNRNESRARYKYSTTKDIRYKYILDDIEIIKNNTYYENYSLRYEYEQKIETLNDKIEEQQKEIEDKENKIMELENIIEDYKYN